MNEETIKRREFIGQAGKIAAGISVGAALAAGAAGCVRATPHVYSQAVSKPPRAPGEKIRTAHIGVGGRGKMDLKKFMECGEVEVKALCDVNKNMLDSAAILAPSQTYGDYHDVLKREDIDAVVIATPDHWHAIIAIEACMAGKDVYVEKPLCLCVEEGRRMVQAARKYGRVVQMGTQQLSGQHYQEAKKVINDGGLGKVTMVRVWNFRNTYPGRGKPPDADPPATLNWDMWLGPRPYVKYNQIKASGAFRFFWDYAGGILTDWGVHHFHTILDVMGYDPPESVMAAGGRYITDDITTVPDNLSVLYQFKDWTMEFSNRETNGTSPYNSEYGIEYCGPQAAMFIDRKGYIITPEKDRAHPKIVGEPGRVDLMPANLDLAHVKNFIECVRTRKMPASEVELGHKATTLAHLGNIAYRTKRQIRWDAANERILDDPEADGLLRRAYRKPYLLPEV